MPAMNVCVSGCTDWAGASMTTNCPVPDLTVTACEPVKRTLPDVYRVLEAEIPPMNVWVSGWTAGPRPRCLCAGRCCSRQ